MSGSQKTGSSGEDCQEGGRLWQTATVGQSASEVLAASMELEIAGQATGAAPWRGVLSWTGHRQDIWTCSVNRYCTAPTNFCDSDESRTCLFKLGCSLNLRRGMEYYRVQRDRAEGRVGDCVGEPVNRCADDPTTVPGLQKGQADKDGACQGRGTTSEGARHGPRWR